MIKTKKFEDLPQITSISPSGKIIVIEQGIDKIISFEDFSNLPPTNDVWNNAGTTFTASEVNVTDTQSAADSKLLDLKVNTVSKFVVRKDGNLGIGVANPAARLDISDTVLAGSGSLAGSILNLAQTWNTTGAPTAIKLNVTNTNSGATSNLLDLQVDTVSKFKVDKSGNIFTTGITWTNTSGNNLTINLGGGGLIVPRVIVSDSTAMIGTDQYGAGVNVNSSASIGWSDSGAAYQAGSPRLFRDVANTLALRNGVNPQSFRLYNTYTSSTNFERLNLRWDTNVLKIGTEKGNAGGTARNLGFETDGTTRMTITSTGLVGIGTTNPTASLDIQGASSGIFLGRSDSEKYIYIQTSASTGYTANSFAIWNGITAAWAGLIMQFTENAGLVFNRDIQNAYTNIRGANVSEPALNITQTSTGDFLSAGTFRLSKSGNLGIGNTVPAARLDIVDTWNSNISVTGATGTGSVATITFATQAAAIPVGATVVVSSVNPSGYNGTFVVTASTVTSISYTNSTTATYVSGGLVKQQYDAIRAFITDTNSDTNSNLLSLNLSTINAVGENWRYKVDKAGNLRSTGTHSIGIGLGNSASLDMGNGWYGFGGGNGIRILTNVTGYVLAHGNTQLWRGRDSVGAGVDHILEQRNGANGQTFNVYNTWSAWNNFERFSISAQNAANVIIGTNKGAAGGLARGLELQTDGTTRMSITGAGLVSIDSIPISRGIGTNTDSIAIGGGLTSNTSGTLNAAFGTNALLSNTTGANNSAFGLYTLWKNTTGSNNLAVAYGALAYNTTGNNNTAIGYSALLTNTDGTYNSAVGTYALRLNTTASYNSALGFSALYLNTTGARNSAVGYNSLYSNTTGYNNVAVGAEALYLNTTGNRNSAFGNYALYSNTTGIFNLAFGEYSLYSNTTGNTNFAFGVYSLYRNTTGVSNLAVGYEALSFNTTGNSNLAIGHSALRGNTTGISNSAFGTNALYLNTTGTNNTAIGHQSLYSNTTASNNSAVGYDSLFSNSTGFSNAALGQSALRSNTTGNNNSSLGFFALYSNTTGINNSAIGSNALFSNTTGSNNTCIGFYALISNTTGIHNLAIGSEAGRYITGGSVVNDISNYSIFLGNNTKAAASGQTNQIVIGDSAQGIGSNSVVLGNDNISTTALKGNVGIGTTAPAYKLSVSDTSGGLPFSSFGTFSSRFYHSAYSLTYDAAGLDASNNARIHLTSTSSNASPSIDFTNSNATSRIYLSANTSENGNLNFSVQGYPALTLRKGDNRQGNAILSSLAGDNTYNNASLLVRNRWDGSPGAVIAKLATSTTADIFQVTNESLSPYFNVSAIGNVGVGITTPLAKLDIAETWNSNISVTGASGTGSVATITFATQAAVIPVGATVVVSSVNPSGYNGTFVVTASTVTSISYTNSTTATYVSGGTVQQLFTAVKVNVTDTASNAASKLLDLQVGGVSKALVDKTGNVEINNSAAFILGSNAGFFSYMSRANNSYGVGFGYTNSIPKVYTSPSFNMEFGNAVFSIFSNTGSFTIGANQDVVIRREDVGILAQRNGINPQTFRLYNTYTDATTFERLNIKWDTNVLKIGTEKGASGGTARAMELQTDGVTRAVINSNGITVGNLNINPTNSAIYNAVIIGFGTNTAYVASPSDGVLRITNNALTSFNRLQFGGETASFPAIKRNGAGIQIRLADDSANAALETAGLTVVGNASVSGHFSAATKSFLIDHPTKEGKKLQYGVVESNQHSVLVRGKTAENIIELPEEWAGLVHEDSVTVQLTPIGSYQQLFVISQDNQRVVVGGSTGQYNYTIYGERKDVDKLITEI